jgi:hypothetical protein
MQPALKRIDPADTPALFRRVGMSASYGDFGCLGGDIPCGCLLTALATDAVGIERTKAALEFDNTPRHARLASLIPLDESYAIGLLCGWDDSAAGESSFDTPMPDTEAACHTAKEFGYLDGRAAFWAICAANRESHSFQGPRS